MKWTGLNELREKFLEFFESKGCLKTPQLFTCSKGRQQPSAYQQRYGSYEKIFYR